MTSRKGYQSTDDDRLLLSPHRSNHDNSSVDVHSHDINDLTMPSQLHETKPWFGKVRSLYLENKGTVARDHLANERTFLAWLRTSLSFISLGIGVTQLFRLNSKSGSGVHEYGKPLGAIFIILGIATLLLGFSRFFHVQALLTKNHFPATRLSILSLIVAVVALIIATFGLVIKVT